MTDHPDNGLAGLVRMTGEMAKALAEQEAQMLELVQAEIDAFGNLILSHPTKTTDKSGETGQSGEADDEAPFDNMPV